MRMGMRMGIPGGGQRRAAWTPASVPGFAWYDVSDDDNVTLDGSSNLSQINDKFGNGRHLAQSTSGARPGRTVWRNGLSAANLDGIDDCMVTSAFTAAPVGPMLIAWAGDLDSLGTIIELDTLPGSDVSLLYFTTTYLPYLAGSGSGAYWLPGSSVMNADAYADVLISATNADVKFFWNGSEKARSHGTFTTSNGTASRVSIGAYLSGSSFCGMNLGEIIIWTGAQATAENAALAREYLRAKWGF